MTDIDLIQMLGQAGGAAAMGIILVVVVLRYETAARQRESEAAATIRGLIETLAKVNEAALAREREHERALFDCLSLRTIPVRPPPDSQP